MNFVSVTEPDNMYKPGWKSGKNVLIKILIGTVTKSKHSNFAALEE